MVRRIAIGCPVAHRSWILDAWFEHLSEACSRSNVEPQFVFAGDPEDRSFEIIERYAPGYRVAYAPNTKPDDRRDWTSPHRYPEMVKLRNSVLAVVRGLDVSFFLSVDSDILLHPDVLQMLLADMDADPWDAIGARCYMTPTGRQCPSWGQMSSQGYLQRADADGYFPVEVIMAIKLMRPSAYWVDYETHVHGEDIGWSLACQRAGLKLAWDGRLASKHVLAPHLLHRLDPRVGF